MMVLAGPGSGKTFVLTQRIAHLINAHHIKPSEILVITFTRAAAGEMQQRFLKRISGHPPVTFGTFHAVFYAILKETSICRSGSILSEPEKKKILRDMIQKNKYDISTDPDMLEEIAAEIARQKNRSAAADINSSLYPAANTGAYRQISPKERPFSGSEDTDLSNSISLNIKPELFFAIYRDFLETQKILGKIDFDDMALKCAELFQERPDILKKYQARFRYLLIDEFQDIAPIQYRLVRMLAEPEHNLFIVGDDDQSIYGFRGAKPEIMLHFPKDYPEAKQVVLKVNYRSTPQIVDAASCLISHNKNRFRKESRAAKENGQAIRIAGFDTIKAQETALIQALLKEQESGTLQNCAVICRTGGKFPALSEKFRQAGIPCVFCEKQKSVFDHEIIEDFLAYLEFAYAKKEERNRARLFRFMNRPLRYISREAVGEQADFSQMMRFYQGRPAMQERIARLAADLERIRNMPVFLALNYIRKAMGYDTYLLEQYGKQKKAEDGYPVLELADLLQNSARGCRTLQQWKTVIEDGRNGNAGVSENPKGDFSSGIRTGKAKAPSGKEDKQSEAGKGVALLTMHGSKGLEYDKVFLLDCNEGITPHKKARSDEEIEEERRMFYVGMTRAKQQLILLYTEGKGGKDGSAERGIAPSRFLEECQARNARRPLHC